MKLDIVPAPNANFSYPGVNDGTGVKFQGTLHDVPGAFTCTESTCQVEADADGRVTIDDGGAFRFTPDDNKATYDRQDSAYTSFGWWLRKPETGAWEVRMFVFGEGDDAASIADVADGTASYSGRAAGKYTTESYSAGVQTDADAGHFTADAKLKATFGDDDTISGTIDNFDLSGPSSGSHWKVTLTEAEPDADTAFGNSTSVTFGGATQTNAGRWTGNFYGADGTDAPGTVAGTFGAGSAGATLVGAFGANK